MERRHYPALRVPGRIYCDVSVSFPLHERVIAAANAAMLQLGVPNKGNYQAAVDASQVVAAARAEIADFLGAHPSEIFFCYGATQVTSELMRQASARCDAVLYAPEDHLATIRAVEAAPLPTYTLAYTPQGRYQLNDKVTATNVMFMATHIHPLYGSNSHFTDIVSAVSPAMTLLDISQSVARTPIDLSTMPVDAAFFSAQKLGGIPGLGVVYVRRSSQKKFTQLSDIEPHTMPIVLLEALRAAVYVIKDAGIKKCYEYLANTTQELVMPALAAMPHVQLTKGVNADDIMCRGYGIVSFSVDGYTSQDIGMIFDNEGVQVRAGDHCVDPAAADQDVVRLSWHCFTTEDELRRILDIIADL